MCGGDTVQILYSALGRICESPLPREHDPHLLLEHSSFYPFGIEVAGSTGDGLSLLAWDQEQIWKYEGPEIYYYCHRGRDSFIREKHELIL